MKERFLEVTKYHSIFAFKLGLAGAFLCFVGGMPLRAGVAIVLLLAIVGIWERDEAPEAPVVYQVRIVPRVGLMLMALGLIEEEEWKRLVSQSRSGSWSSLHLERGISAIVLQESVRQKGPGHTLVNWIAHNADTGKDFRISADSFEGKKLEYHLLSLA